LENAAAAAASSVFEQVRPVGDVEGAIWVLTIRFFFPSCTSLSYFP
jgi:hypothetical protein